MRNKSKKLLVCYIDNFGFARQLKCDSIDREIMEHDKSLYASISQGRMVAFVKDKIVATWPPMDTHWIKPL